VVTVPTDFQVTRDSQRVYSNHVTFHVVTGDAPLRAPIHFDDDPRLPFGEVVAFAGLQILGARSRREQATETLRGELRGVAGIHNVRVQENADGLDFLVTVDVELYDAETVIIPVFQSLMGVFPDLAIEFMIASADEIGPEVVTSWGDDLCSPDQT